MQASSPFDFLESRYFVYVLWFAAFWLITFSLWVTCCWFFRVRVPQRKAGIICLLVLLPVGTVLTAWRPVVDQVLRHAILSGNVSYARLALSLGAGTNGCTDTAEMQIPSLEIAVRRDDAPMMHLLIEHGANINGVVGGDTSTLGLAEKRGHPEIIRMLQKVGAIKYPDDTLYQH